MSGREARRPTILVARPAGPASRESVVSAHPGPADRFLNGGRSADRVGGTVYAGDEVTAYRYDTDAIAAPATMGGHPGPVGRTTAPVSLGNEPGWSRGDDWFRSDASVQGHLGVGRMVGATTGELPTGGPDHSSGGSHHDRL